MRPPRFVTFTGADDATNTAEMMLLSLGYPIEWGILLSRDCGRPRYPAGWEKILRDLSDEGLRVSVHLCGEYARAVNTTGRCLAVEEMAGTFQRVQVNTTWADEANCLAFAKRVGARLVLQTRNAFALDDRFDCLFDQSGGRGVTASVLPAAPDESRLFGYAGGISPGSAYGMAETCGKIAAHYWLDMETGVRDDRDRFSVKKCESVCVRLWPDREEGGRARRAYLGLLSEEEKRDGTA